MNLKLDSIQFDIKTELMKFHIIAKGRVQKMCNFPSEHVELDSKQNSTNDREGIGSFS